MYHVFLEQLLHQEGTEQNHLAELLCHQGLSCQFYQVHVFLGVFLLGLFPTATKTRGKITALLSIMSK